MKKVLLLFVAFCVGVAGFAQKVYFIYLQADNGTPFFVKMAGKVYSSTASGYLILPKLVDSTYTFTIGFPESPNTEPQFSVTINNFDRGLLIKKSDEGISLFDWQTAQVYQPAATVTVQNATTTKTDNFTKLLSQAADDASLLTVPVVVKKETPAEKKPEKTESNTQKTIQPKETVAEKKPTTETAVPRQDTVLNTPSATQGNTIAEKPVAKTEDKVAQATVDTAQKENNMAATTVMTTTAPAPPEEKTFYQRSTIVKRSESSTTEGFGLVYIDKTNESIDTIRLLIPNSNAHVLINAGQTTDARPVQETPKSKEVSEMAAPPVAATTAPNSSTAERPACNAVASDADFKKLRRNMAAKESDEDMVDEAKKYFRKRCFTTEQIKNLSTLFLTSSGKYQFFDAAYMHVADPGQYKTLQSEIKDSYYANRFKALIGNQ